MENKNYINDDELLLELRKWRDSSQDPNERQPSERLGQLMLLLHDRILLHENFRRYRQDLKDEMRSWSLFRIFKRGLFTYNFQTSPFSYFTRAIFVNYAQVLKRYYQKINLHREYIKGELVKMNFNGNTRLEQFLKNFRCGND